jgi:hypothetical protein
VRAPAVSKAVSKRRGAEGAPVAGGDLVNKHDLVCVGRHVAFQQGGSDLAIAEVILAQQDQDTSGHAVLERVHRGALLSFFGYRAAGFLRVAVVGCELAGGLP